MRVEAARALAAIALAAIALGSALAASAVVAQPAAAPAEPARAQPLADDPELEARVLRLADELRCLVCQNETIAASNAELAVDLRRQIRQKLAAGESEQQIRDYMVERYGEFVLYRPPLNASTVLLWVGPFVLLVVAAGVLVHHVRRHRPRGNAALSPAEAERVRRLLADDPSASANR
ncbi:MAG: cytochrome c-type biogenesis protein CcmH [Burkholderiaceae bacterium]|jgi:cytochrome c-type biogenesis protein CcmH|nr:cytochrome c-type biogenesis protein CcmH [Burkholderiaceae bacterium]